MLKENGINGLKRDQWYIEPQCIMQWGYSINILIEIMNNLKKV